MLNWSPDRRVNPGVSIELEAGTHTRLAGHTTGTGVG